jgi:hypothetical protein
MVIHSDQSIPCVHQETISTPSKLYGFDSRCGGFERSFELQGRTRQDEDFTLRVASDYVLATPVE